MAFALHPEGLNNAIAQARPRFFGEAHAITGTTSNPQRFPGQLYDPETGFHYNYFRDYAPGLGRYVESDPIGLWGGVNTYAYVGGDPLNYMDPTGEFAILAPAVPAILDFALGYTIGLGLAAGVGILASSSGESEEQCPPTPSAGRHTPDQEAVVDLAKEAKKKGGLTSEEAEALKDLADEAGLPTRGPETHPDRKHGKNPHIHIGPIDHIPVK